MKSKFAKLNFQMTSIALLLGFSTISQAALTNTTGPVSFSGSASVTATGGQVASATNSNNNAAIANVAVGQFGAASGVLTGVDLQLSSNRTQTINGIGNKNNGPGRTVNGSGTSNALLSAAGISANFAPNLTQAGAGCSLAHGPTGAVSCSWGPNTSAATATNTTVGADSQNLNDYAGSGSVNASLSLPTLSATTTMSATQGQAGSGSSATYKVDWSGNLQANYTYLLHSAGSFDGNSAQNTLTLDFGTVAQNSSPASLAFSVFNLADANRIGLDLDGFTSTGSSSAFTTNLATFADLQQANSQLFSASLLTDTAGAFSAQYIVNLSDADLGASSTRQSSQLTLNLVGNVAPVPVPGAVWLLGSGLAGLIGLQRRKQML